jgi:hypothetical protein
MPIGDDASAQGYPLVPDTGEAGRVRYGGQEINLTRDFVARLKVLIPGSKSAYRDASGISSGTADPTGGNDGDIYFKILP